MKCVIIGKDGWWNVADITKEDMASTLNADRVGHAAVDIKGADGMMRFGCAYDVDGRAKALPNTVIARLQPRFRWMKAKYKAYIDGPVILYLNRGLTDSEVAIIESRILMFHENPILIINGAKENDDYGEEEL